MKRKREGWVERVVQRKLVSLSQEIKRKAYMNNTSSNFFSGSNPVAS